MAFWLARQRADAFFANDVRPWFMCPLNFFGGKLRRYLWGESLLQARTGAKKRHSYTERNQEQKGFTYYTLHWHWLASVMWFGFLITPERLEEFSFFPIKKNWEPFFKKEKLRNFSSLRLGMPRELVTSWLERRTKLGGWFRILIAGLKNVLMPYT